MENNEESFSYESDSSESNSRSGKFYIIVVSPKSIKNKKEINYEMQTNPSNDIINFPTLDMEDQYFNINQNKNINHNTMYEGKQNKGLTSTETISLLNTPRRRSFNISDSDISFLKKLSGEEQTLRRRRSNSFFLENKNKNFCEEEHKNYINKEMTNKTIEFKNEAHTRLLKSDDQIALNYSNILSKIDIKIPPLENSKNFIKRAQVNELDTIIVNSNTNSNSKIALYYDIPVDKKKMISIEEVSQYFNESSLDENYIPTNKENQIINGGNIRSSGNVTNGANNGNGANIKVKYIEEKYCNNISNSNNNFNSTEELFAMLNRKIDNFNKNNVTASTIKLDNFYKNINFDLNSNSNINQDYINQNSLGMNSNHYKYENNTGSNIKNDLEIIDNNYIKKFEKISNSNIIGNLISKGFKKNISLYSDLDDLQISKIAHVIARDQYGCRFLQKKIIDNPGFANDVLFFELQNSMLELIQDNFGNYLIQKLIENLDDTKIIWIINLVIPFFLEVCFSSQGSRVLQKIIEYLSNQKLFDLFNKVFIPNVIALSKNINAYHIVEKYVMTIRYPQNWHIFEVIVNNLYEIACDKHGCCVLQKMVQVLEGDQKALVINKILSSCLNFISDQYGNYIIQHILSFNEYTINKFIALIIIPHIRVLCKHKFSSNVIEKCFDHSNVDIQDLIVSAIVNDESLTDELIVDMYGNYVLQKALAVAKGENYIKILENISMNIYKLKSVPFGSKLLAKLLTSYPELPALINTNSKKNFTKNNIKKDFKQPNFKKQNDNLNYNNYNASNMNFQKSYQNVNNHNNIQNMNFGNNNNLILGKAMNNIDQKHIKYINSNNDYYGPMQYSNLPLQYWNPHNQTNQLNYLGYQNSNNHLNENNIMCFNSNIENFNNYYGAKYNNNVYK